jgi:hypothetical protein
MIGERKGGCFASEQVVPETGPDGWRLLLLFFSGTCSPEKTRTLLPVVAFLEQLAHSSSCLWIPTCKDKSCCTNFRLLLMLMDDKHVGSVSGVIQDAGGIVAGCGCLWCLLRVLVGCLSGNVVESRIFGHSSVVLSGQCVSNSNPTTTGE